MRVISRERYPAKRFGGQARRCLSRGQKGNDVTDRIDPGVGQNDAAAEPDAAPPVPGQRAPSAINGKSSLDALDVESSRMQGDLNGTTPHRPGAKIETGSGIADDLRQDEPVLGDNPGPMRCGRSADLGGF